MHPFIVLGTNRKEGCGETPSPKDSGFDSSINPLPQAPPQEFPGEQFLPSSAQPRFFLDESVTLSRSLFF